MAPALREKRRTLSGVRRPFLAVHEGALGLATAILDRPLDHLAALAGALLYPADEFLLFAFNICEIIVGELSPFLLDFALGDVPVSFEFECFHWGSFVSLGRQPAAAPAAACQRLGY